MPRFDVFKRNRRVAFVEDATLYSIDEDGYSTPVCECEETPAAIKAAVLERLCVRNVPVSRLGIKIVNRRVA